MERQQVVLLGQQKEAKLELAQARQEMETKMEKLREEMTPPEPAPAITEEELATLQARVQALHAAQLLADEELFVAEDLCADYLELQASVPSGGVLTQEAIQTCVGHSYAAAAKLLKLVRLSAGMASDAAFARQLKRKFV